jgi:magnesium transporter
VAVDPEAPRSQVRLVAYGPEQFTELEVKDLHAIRDRLDRFPVTWVNVDGLGDASAIEKLGEIFGLHHLALEDVVNTPQRPKVDPYPDHRFVVVQMPQPGDRLDLEQLSLFLGPKFLLTFQERAGGDCLNPVRERLRQGRARIRSGGPDYLAYAVLDAVVDAYFPLLEELGDQLEVLETKIIDRPDRDAIAKLHQVKRDLLAFRRAIWPLREVIGTLSREETPLIAESTRLYLRDCQDHTIQLVEVIETLRDTSSGLIDLYLSSVSNRLNEVMKFLTIVGTIFMPLTFIAGVYGMNFQFMPEIPHPYGYPAVLVLMALIGAMMLLYFRRKKWI